MKKIWKSIILCSLIFIVLWLALCLHQVHRQRMFIHDFNQRVADIQTKDIEELTLEIYYTDPNVFTRHPWRVEDLIRSCDEKKTIKGDQLVQFIKNLSKIDPDSLSFAQEETYLNARIAYILKNQKNEKLLEVALWGWGTENDDYVYVNNIPLKDEQFFYDLIVETTVQF